LPLSKRSSHAAPLTGLPSRASRFPAACPGGPGLTGDPTRPASWGPLTAALRLPKAPTEPTGPHQASLVGRPRPARRACPPETAASARRRASSIPLAKAPLEGTPRSRLGGAPWRSGATRPRRSLDPRTRPAWPGSSASGDRSTTAAPSMRRTRDRRRDRPWGSGPPSWRRSGGHPTAAGWSAIAPGLGPERTGTLAASSRPGASTYASSPSRSAAIARAARWAAARRPSCRAPRRLRSSLPSRTRSSSTSAGSTPTSRPP